MSKFTPPESYSIQGNGAGSVQMALTTAASAALIPLDASGKLPKIVYLQANGTCYVTLQSGVASPSATAQCLQMNPNTPIRLNTDGLTAVSAIADTGTIKLNVTALETA